MTSSYTEVAELLLTLKNCVVLTGAGISAESGIPTFRSKDGLWEKYDPMVYASIEVFRRDPSKYWQIRGDFIRNYDTYTPNAGFEGTDTFTFKVTHSRGDSNTATVSSSCTHPGQWL